jgi:hypothetical protein
VTIFRIDQPIRASIHLLAARAAKTIVRREAAVTVNYEFLEVTPPSRRGSLDGLPLVSPLHLLDRSAEPEDGAVREQLVTAGERADAWEAGDDPGVRVLAKRLLGGLLEVVGGLAGGVQLPQQGSCRRGFPGGECGCLVVVPAGLEAVP